MEWHDLRDIKNPNTRFLVVLTLFGIVFLSVGDVATGLSASAFSIYFVMFISIMIMILLALVSNGRAADIRLFGNIDKKWKFAAAALSGALFALAFSLKPIFGINSVGLNLNNLIPPVSASVTNSTQGFNYVVSAFMAPFIEEPFRAGTLVPSLKKWIPILGIGPIFIIMGGILALILYNTAFYIGLLIALFGVVVLAVPKLRDITRINNIDTQHLGAYIVVSAIAIVIGSAIWAALHVFAYSGVADFWGALESIFVIGILLEIFNIVLFDSIVFSMVAHSALNAVIFGITFGFALAVGYIIAAFLAIVLYLVFSVGGLEGVKIRMPSVSLR